MGTVVATNTMGPLCSEGACKVDFLVPATWAHPSV